jgi:hypothetical protein
LPLGGLHPAMADQRFARQDGTNSTSLLIGYQGILGHRAHAKGAEDFSNAVTLDSKELG